MKNLFGGTREEYLVVYVKKNDKGIKENSFFFF